MYYRKTPTVQFIFDSDNPYASGTLDLQKMQVPEHYKQLFNISS
jgi:hypothetical protein